MLKTKKPLIAITGASSGIGKAIAEKFSQKGYPLLLMARRLDLLQALNLPNCICKKVDVTSQEDIKVAISKAETQFGPVECLVNSAGIIETGSLTEQSVSLWQNMVDTNIMGILKAMDAVIPQMVERKKGTIINISSLAGRKPAPGAAVYSGTKYAVHTITDSLRQELLKDKVRLIIIGPGFTETEMIIPKSEIEKQRLDTAFKKIGPLLKAEDVANAVWYAYSQPDYVNIREIALNCVGEAF